MKLISDRPLTGAYGTVLPGREFEVDDELGDELLKTIGPERPDKGQPIIVRRAGSPKILYETKPARFETPTVAPEVSARLPFRDRPVSDQESQGLATESDLLLSGSDISEPGNADHRMRRGRSRSGSGR